MHFLNSMLTHFHVKVYTEFCVVVNVQLYIYSMLIFRNLMMSYHLVNIHILLNMCIHTAYVRVLSTSLWACPLILKGKYNNFHWVMLTEQLLYGV